MPCDGDAWWLCTGLDGDTPVYRQRDGKGRSTWLLERRGKGWGVMRKLGLKSLAPNIISKRGFRLGSWLASNAALVASDPLVVAGERALCEVRQQEQRVVDQEQASGGGGAAESLEVLRGRLAETEAHVTETVTLGAASDDTYDGAKVLRLKAAQRTVEEATLRAISGGPSRGYEAAHRAPGKDGVIEMYELYDHLHTLLTMDMHLNSVLPILIPSIAKAHGFMTFARGVAHVASDLELVMVPVELPLLLLAFVVIPYEEMLAKVDSNHRTTRALSGRAECVVQQLGPNVRGFVDASLFDASPARRARRAEVPAGQAAPADQAAADGGGATHEAAAVEVSPLFTADGLSDDAKGVCAADGAAEALAALLERSRRELVRLMALISRVSNCFTWSFQSAAGKPRADNMLECWEKLRSTLVRPASDPEATAGLLFFAAAMTRAWATSALELVVEDAAAGSAHAALTYARRSFLGFLDGAQHKEHLAKEDEMSLAGVRARAVSRRTAAAAATTPGDDAGGAPAEAEGVATAPLAELLTADERRGACSQLLRRHALIAGLFAALHDTLRDYMLHEAGDRYQILGTSLKGWPRPLQHPCRRAFDAIDPANDEPNGWCRHSQAFLETLGIKPDGGMSWEQESQGLEFPNHFCARAWSAEPDPWHKSP